MKTHTKDYNIKVFATGIGRNTFHGEVHLAKLKKYIK